MALSRRIIRPETGSGVPRQVASTRLVIMAAILFNLSRHSLEAARGPPRALTNIVEHRVRVGDRVRLTCSVDSDPPSLVEWQKDGRMIHDGWERFRISRNQSLTITNISSGDRGSYVCRAANGFGSVDIRHIVRLINWSPSLRSTDEPETYLAPSVGSSVRLLCRLPTGSQASTVTWYKDGAALSHEFDDVMTDASLTLKDVTLADSGVYECRYPDGAKESNVTYVIDVIEDRSRPSFIEAPANVIATFAGTATFFCHVRSETVPSIQWLKRVDGVKAEEDEEEKGGLNPSGTVGRVLHIDDERFQVLSGTRSVSRSNGSYVSKLLIRSVRSQDAGLYLCTCTNNNGYIVSRAYLTIRRTADDVAADENEVRRGLSSEGQDLPILSLFAVLAVLALLVLFAILSYAIYRSRFKSPASSSSTVIVEHSRRWAALPPVNHFRRRRRSTSATLLQATPESSAAAGRHFEHRYAIVASTLQDQQHCGSFWTASTSVDLCTFRSSSPTPAGIATYSSQAPGSMVALTNETTYSPVHARGSPPTLRTTYSPTNETTYSPTHRTTVSSRSTSHGSGYSDCASARVVTSTEVTSQFGFL